MTTTEALKSAATARDTDVLIGALLLLDAKGQGSLTEAERLVQAITSDVITERHDLSDSLDAVLFDEEFEGTYTEALLICLAMQDAA